tara:strand:- start:4963 stop:7134 length:2172 start_codon:yes stop_codon:yes gene_type:complete
MKKIILWPLALIFSLTFFLLVYLSLIGYETDKFNSLLEKKVSLSIQNTEIKFKKIRIKINIKNLSFFLTTLNPEIKYQDNNIKIKKIDVYVNLKSVLKGKPEIEKINISSNEIDINEIKKIIRYQKPSNFKKFFINDVESGKATFKLDLYLVKNKIKNYEINGTIKNLNANANKIDFKKMSFVYTIKKNNGEISNIRGLINGFQINTGSFEFDNNKSLNIKGNIKSDLKLSKIDFDKLLKKETTKNLERLQLSGKIQSLFEVQFDKTLKVIDYQLKASGDIKKFDIKFQKPKKYLYIKNSINNLGLEKTKFKIRYNKNNKKLLDLSGLYSVNNNLLQKFNFKNLYDSKSKLISISGDFNNEIYIPFLNFSSKNKVVNLITTIEISKNNINLKKFNLKEDKNKIEINNLSIKNKKLLKFDNIYVKTFKNGKFNNDFKVSFGQKIKVEGIKYDASNLTKLLEKNNNSNFLNNISKEIKLNIKEISTNADDVISNFNLIGDIEKGKFNKIVSKGEFKDGKYLDISLRLDKKSNKKILEIYSDLPKPLLSNYKFFNGLSGGQLLIFSSYDSKVRNTNLTIENFKVRDAPGLAKLLSLADFGGMVDAVSGDGLSFEKLDMSIVQSDQVLNLKELYAIGPSVSILMEGYVESNTGLVSLRGTMVPAKTLNKFLSKLPIVGDILIPKEIGEGLFGISFKMKGVPGKIKTSVNPIKTLTPRFIQKALKKPK